MRSTRKFRRRTSSGRNIAIGVAAVLTALIVTVLTLPGFIDWNRFRGQIEGQASSLTGRQVRISGPIRFRMLPRPALSLENTSIANIAGASVAQMLSAERLDAQFGLLALLSGKIQVANFRLIAPVLNLETLADGVNNWDFLSGGRDTPRGIAFEHVTIERGEMRYHDLVRAISIEAREIALQLSAESLGGPFSLSGAMRLQDVPLQLDMTLGDYTRDRGISLTFKSALPAGSSVEFNGNLSSDTGITGTLKSQGTDFTALMASMALLGMPGPPQLQAAHLRHPYQLEGSIASTAGSLKFDNVKINLNENAFTGAFALENGATPAFTAELKTSSLDLDKFLQAGPSGITAATTAAPDSDTQPAPSLTGTVRFTANVVKIHGGAVRDVILAASISGGAVALDDFSAHLPGSTTAHISGRLEYPLSQPAFSGKLDLQSENLRALLGWLGLEIAGVPERSLSRAHLSALLNVSPGLAQLHEVSAEFDTSRLTGDLALALRGRTALGIDARIDQLNLDNYLPTDERLEPADPAAAEQISNIMPPWPEARALISRYDSNFKLYIDSLTYRGVPLQKIQADGSMINGALTVNSFTVSDLAGTAVSMSGALNNLSAVPEGQVNLRLASNDIGGFARAFGLTLPVPGAQLGKSSIDAKFQLANATLAATVESLFGETALQLSCEMRIASPGGMPPPDAARSRMRLMISNPSLRKIAAQAGYTIRPAQSEEDAGLALTAEVNGGDGEIIVSALNGTIGTFPIQGRASWNSLGAKPVLHIEAHAGEILSEKLFSAGQDSQAAKPGASRQLPWSGTPLNLSFLEQFEAEIKLDAVRFSFGGYDFVKPSLTFELKDGVANLKHFSGQLFGGEASASASLRNAGAAPEIKAEWNLKAADMQSAAMAFSGSPSITGQLDFSGSVSGVGASSFALVSSLEGKALLTAQNGFIQGMDLPAFSTQLSSLERASDFLKLAETALQAGNTPYKSIRVPFTVGQGVAQSDKPELYISAATGGLEISLDLPRYWLNAEASLTLNEHMDAPPLGIAFIGPLNDPERSLRVSKLENHFTQALMSKSLQRVISNRDMAPMPPAAGAPPAAPELPLPQDTPAPEAAPPQTVLPASEPPKNVINRILDGIIRDKPK